MNGEVMVNWLFNVIINDILVIYALVGWLY